MQFFVYQVLGVQKRSKTHVLGVQYFVNKMSFRTHFANFPVWYQCFPPDGGGGKPGEFDHISQPNGGKFV